MTSYIFAADTLWPPGHSLEHGISKRRKLAEIGEVQTVTPHTEAEITRTLDALVQQKARFFARIGLRNIFERPGYMNSFASLRPVPLH